MSAAAMASPYGAVVDGRSGPGHSATVAAARAASRDPMTI